MLEIMEHDSYCKFKYADTPDTTKSMRVVMEDLKIDKLWVVYPGHRSFALDEKIESAALSELPEVAAKL